MIMLNTPPVSMLDIQVGGAPDGCDVELTAHHEGENLACYTLKLNAQQPSISESIDLSWRIPAHGVQGVWTTDALYEKRLRADWELEPLRSHISQNAPVVCLFGHNDENVHVFASSDALYVTDFRAVVREEDNFIYCEVKLFPEGGILPQNYEAELRIDSRPIPFSEALGDVAQWWASFDTMAPQQAPEEAFDPVYSTWYSFHQHLDTKALLAECSASSSMGYKTIIVDDGWQTLDGNRGYDYTGDWNPDRIPDMAEFVADVHKHGMKCMLWYSVPFMGTKSKAYKQFNDKCLTHKHRWAPVLDPRFPEVRAYLIEKYRSALTDWDIDGFKLDFIDDFRVYEDTEVVHANGRDYLSVEEAVERLLSDITRTLKAIKPGILLEFRQRYTGPLMRTYGNMFRAFDCPNDSVTNRIRTTDLRLLTTRCAVHSDMVTWHHEEPVETAALQLVNVVFSVPQLSIRLSEVSVPHRRMIEAFTHYWLENRELLLFGRFYAKQPLANYPILEVYNEDKGIAALYQDMVFRPEEEVGLLDIINAKPTDRVVIDLNSEFGACEIAVFDCQGENTDSFQQSLHAGIHSFQIPPSGRLEIRRVKN